MVFSARCKNIVAFGVFQIVALLQFVVLYHWHNRLSLLVPTLQLCIYTALLTGNENLRIGHAVAAVHKQFFRLLSGKLLN